MRVANGSDRHGWVVPDNSLATKLMVGLDPGLVLVQANPTETTNTTWSAVSPVGRGRRWSSKSFIYKLELLGNDRRSAGCLPIITSNITTPKLYTSHLSVTLIVNASSAVDNR